MSDQRLPPGQRGIRLASAPTRSVVVASTRDLAALHQCLAALLPVCLPRAIEVVVARSCSIDEHRELERAYPRVLFMPGPANASDRRLRGVGLSAADGDIVTLLDDRQAGADALLAVLAVESGSPGPEGNA